MYNPSIPSISISFFLIPNLNGNLTNSQCNIIHQRVKSLPPRAEDILVKLSVRV